MTTVWERDWRPRPNPAAVSLVEKLPRHKWHPLCAENLQSENFAIFSFYQSSDRVSASPSLAGFSVLYEIKSVKISVAKIIFFRVFAIFQAEREKLREIKK